jgi:asparagine synthase (glutamine-hydrolysing)
MPSISAVVNRDRSSPDADLQRMMGRMQHYRWLKPLVARTGAEGVALGAVVLDHVPDADVVFSAADGSAIVFDGEIYESAGERLRLEREGVTFSTGGCAELVLRGWQRERNAFFTRLSGLFSAAIWDQERQELAVATDRFGLRPTYVAEPPGSCLVASEIKALLVHPGLGRKWSEDGVAEFFAFGYLFNEDTLFQDVRAVPPASCAIHRPADGSYTETRYWVPRPVRTTRSHAELVTALETSLSAATSRRADSGDALGLSLSGGLDARTLLGLMPRPVNLTTVSIGIEGSIDHRGASRLAELAGVRHHEYILDDTFLEHFEQHLQSMILLTDGHYLDQGIVMPTLETYRALGIQKLVRGHGGELLHMTKAYAFSLDPSALQASSPALERWLFDHLTAYMLRGVPSDIFAIDVPARARAALKTAYERAAAFDVPIDRVWQLFLTERLHRETALSMHKFGCFATVRLPYLDNEVIDAVLSMPAGMKLDGTLQTEILRRRRPEFLPVVNSNTGARLGAGRLETAVASLRLRVYAKLGVRGYQPYERLGLWLKRELKPMTERVLLGDQFLSRGLVRPDALRRVASQHASGQENHTFLLMSLFIFELGQRMLEDPERFAQQIRQ